MMPTIRFYDPKGKPYSGNENDQLFKWARDFEINENRVLIQIILENGIFISTVWVGLDQSHNGIRPLIFETMVFSSDPKNHDILDMERYSTREEAFKGHHNMIRKWAS